MNTFLKLNFLSLTLIYSKNKPLEKYPLWKRCSEFWSQSGFFVLPDSVQLSGFGSLISLRGPWWGARSIHQCDGVWCGVVYLADRSSGSRIGMGLGGHDTCCRYLCKQECNPFRQPAHLTMLWDVVWCLLPDQLVNIIRALKIRRSPLMPCTRRFIK